MKQFPAITQTLILTSLSFSTLSLLVIAPVQAASFIGLGDFVVHNPFHDPFYHTGVDDNRNYYNSRAYDVSADGSVVIGAIDGDWTYSFPGENQIAGYSFRWTQEDGINIIATGRSDNPYHPPSSSANIVSADGSVVVGSSFNPGYRVYMDSYSGFRWTPELGQVNFPAINANDISANGSVIVGSYGQAFRWTQETGIISLGNLGNTSKFSEAKGVSADGSVVVGVSANTNGYNEAFRWTQETGMIGLGSLIGNSDSKAKGVSSDGSVIIGTSYIEAFRWTQETGMVGLGSLTSNGGSFANAVSADGSIIVGTSANQPFRWTKETGMVSLKETLIGEGLDVSGWTLSSANAISADGFTIVGNGINPSGQSEAWVANLEPIPEPLTILGSIAAIAFATGFERKFGQNKSDEKDPDA
jgi:probable HAF family extracellular repeat protein